MRISPLKLKLAAVLAASATVAALGVGAAAPAGAAGPTIQPHRIKVDPRSATGSASTRTPACSRARDRPIDGSQGPRCYQPCQIQNGVRRHPAARPRARTAPGRTIVIVDAFEQPVHRAATCSIFDSGLRAAGRRTSRMIAPAGAPPPFDPNDANQVGWAERDHARRASGPTRSRPGAKIVLVAGHEQQGRRHPQRARSTPSTTTSVTSSRRASARPSSAWTRPCSPRQHAVFAQGQQPGA